MLFLHEADNTLGNLSEKFLTFVASLKQAKRLVITFSPPAEGIDLLDLLNAGKGALETWDEELDCRTTLVSLQRTMDENSRLALQGGLSLFCLL